MRGCYDGYFKDFGVILKRLSEDGFEEEYKKLKMKRIYDDTQEDLVWKNVDPDDIRVMDKLILSPES